VFVSLRDESEESADARQEPLTAMAGLAGIAGVLGTPVARQLLNDASMTNALIPVWAFFGGVMYALAFYAVFSIFPFAIRQFAQVKGPWFAAALAGPAQFFLVHQLVKAAWPNQIMGLLPAAFALPAILGLVGVLRTVPADSLAMPYA